MFLAVSDLFAARSQMALSLDFHIVFAEIGIALPLMMVLAEWRWHRTGDAVFLQLAKRWSKGAAILFAVGFIVFFIIGNQVMNREPIVGGDKVDAGIRSSSRGFVQIRTARETISKLAQGLVLSAPVIAHNFVTRALRLPCNRREDLVRCASSVQRRDQRLQDRCRAVVRAHVAPGLEIMRLRNMPVTQSRRFVLMKR